MHRLPQCHHGNPQLANRSIEHPIVTADIPSQDIHQVLSHPKIQSNITKPQRKTLNSSQGREGRIPYDPTIIGKLVVHQDRTTSRTQEREIKHIATGTYPQSRGWTTPSSSWRMSGANTGSRLVFGGYRGLRRRNFWSRLIPEGFSIYRNFWRWFHVREVSGLSTR